MSSSSFAEAAEPTFIIASISKLFINICVVLAAFTFPTPASTSTTSVLFIFPFVKVNSYNPFLSVSV